MLPILPEYLLPEQLLMHLIHLLVNQNKLYDLRQALSFPGPKVIHMENRENNSSNLQGFCIHSQVKINV